jgi:hypothetical protein
MPNPILDSIVKGMTQGFTDLEAALKDELAKQGHVLSGKLRDSITFEVRIEGTKVIGVFLAENYGLILESGVPASKIPYSGRTGKGGTSKYIAGLVRFFELRGKDSKTALRMAFATANKQRREGMPTRGAFRFTQNGRRINWIRQTLESKLSDVGAAISQATALEMRLQYAEALELEPLRIPI